MTAEVIVIIKNQDASVRLGFAVEPGCRQAAQATTHHHQIVGLCKILNFRLAPPLALNHPMSDLEGARVTSPHTGASRGIVDAGFLRRSTEGCGIYRWIQGRFGLRPGTRQKAATERHPESADEVSAANRTADTQLAISFSHPFSIAPPISGFNSRSARITESFQHPWYRRVEHEEPAWRIEKIAGLSRLCPVLELLDERAFADAACSTQFGDCAVTLFDRGFD
jgi:hypothetical protein